MARRNPASTFAVSGMWLAASRSFSNAFGFLATTAFFVGAGFLAAAGFFAGVGVFVGVDLFDVEIVLSAMPPGIRSYYRRGVAAAYMDDYFVPRLVAVDLLAHAGEGEADTGRLLAWMKIVGTRYPPLPLGERVDRPQAETGEGLVPRALTSPLDLPPGLALAVFVLVVHQGDALLGEILLPRLGAGADQFNDFVNRFSHVVLPGEILAASVPRT